MTNVTVTHDRRFADIYNDVESYPTLMDVAAAMDLAVKTVKNRAGLMRAALEDGEDVPVLISRATLTLNRFGPEHLVEIFEDVARQYVDGKVTQARFTRSTGMDEAKWKRHFGTWDAFARAAGQKPTAGADQVHRDIAKHAKVDHQRAMNEERQSYNGKYDRGGSNRYKTILGANDLHDIEVDRFWLRTFIDTADRVQPDVICLNGDIFDLAEFGKYNVDPREWDAVGRIKFAHENILEPLREVCPDAQIDLIEGNHEFRLLRLLSDAAPQLQTLLSDLHGMSVSQLLGLDKYEINYICKADLSAWTKSAGNREVAKNYKIYWDSVLACHFPHAKKRGLPGWNGHHHKHLVDTLTSPIYGAYEWHQFGCGHKQDASYCEGENWGMGFGLINVDTHKHFVNFDYVTVSDFAVSGGKFYHRTDAERYGDDHLFSG